MNFSFTRLSGPGGLSDMNEHGSFLGSSTLMGILSLPRASRFQTCIAFSISAQMRSPTMRATFVIVLFAVIGRLGLAQQDGEDVLPYSDGGYGRHGGPRGNYASVSEKFADSQKGK